MRMTLGDVEGLLFKITKKATEGDDEAAHTIEDDLHYRVLKAIADGECDDPSLLACRALNSSTIKFARWCA